MRQITIEYNQKLYSVVLNGVSEAASPMDDVLRTYVQKSDEGEFKICLIYMNTNEETDEMDINGTIVQYGKSSGRIVMYNALTNRNGVAATPFDIFKKELLATEEAKLSARFSKNVQSSISFLHAVCAFIKNIPEDTHHIRTNTRMIDFINKIVETKFEGLSEASQIVLRKELLVYLKKKYSEKIEQGAGKSISMQVSEAFAAKNLDQFLAILSLDQVRNMAEDITKNGKVRSVSMLDERSINKYSIFFKYYFKPCRKQVEKILSDVENFIKYN